MTSKLAFGGCHWCTEGIFQCLKGVKFVDQGWIASNGANAVFSEGVLIQYDSTIIDL